MSVCEYHNWFTQLSLYAPKEVDSDAKKQKQFVKGLNDGLELQPITVVYADYQTLVDRAIVIENKRQEMEEKKRTHDLQCQLRNTRLCFATQPEYQSHPMNLLVSNDQDQYHQPNDEVQHFSSQEPCLSSPTITLITTNISTSKEGYDCGEIEHYKNDCFEKFAESNRSQNQ